MSDKEPKSKKKGLKTKLRELKKPIIGGGIVATVAITGIISGIYWYIGALQETGGTFIMGYSGGLDAIDPLTINTYDPIIFNQIAEPLFNEDWNQTTNYYENVPYLAEEGIWSGDKLNFTCTLRKGIRFHDGTLFNASAVKWNFDRLQNLLNNISNSGFWYNVDGIQILNRTEVIDDYIVRFVLNKAFVPFQSLLTYSHAYIVSPTSTPSNRFLDPFTEKTVGTGPYIFESNVIYVNTTIVKNKNYWGTPKPVIDKFIFLNLGNVQSNEKFLSKETHFAIGNDSYFEAYLNDSTIVVDDFVGKEFDYLGMNNKRINTTMRKAISYALNYTAILERHDFYSHGSNIRCRSPLPLGTLYSNWEDFKVPYYNVSIARQVLKDANWPGTANLTANNNITAGNEWEVIAESSTPLGIYNISYIIGRHNIIEDLPLIVTENLRQIGVKVITIAMTGGQHWGNIFASNTDLFWLGWEIDYHDATNTLNSLFSANIDGYVNYHQTNDSIIQDWLKEGVEETKPIQRAQIYNDLQKYLIEEAYPLAWLYSPIWYDIYRTNLKGWGYWGSGSFKYLSFN